MSRQIITASTRPESARPRNVPNGDSASTQKVDEYSDKLLKLIPAEVIGAYLSMQVILKSSGDADAIGFIVGTFVFGVVATYFYLRVVLKVTNGWQILISMGAFCVWAYAIFTPVDPDQFTWHNGTLAGLMLIGYTFFAPKIPLGNGTDES